MAGSEGKSRKDAKLKKFLEHVALACLITGVLLGVKYRFDKTDAGKIFEESVYTLLQSRLSDQSTPIVVVDISGLDAQQVPAHQPPREQLKELIHRIADYKPIAIGIDVDFSPERNGWTERGGPELFEDLKSLQSGDAPLVYLGVDRSRYGAPEDWLGLARYQEFAVSLALFSRARRGIPLWLARYDSEDCSKNLEFLNLTSSKSEPPGGNAAQPCLYSISARLATRYLSRNSASWDARFRNWLAGHSLGLVRNSESYEPPPGRKSQYAEPPRQIHSAFYRVDYGLLETLKDHTIRAANLQAGRSDLNAQISGKVVILGNTEWEATLDKYPAPPWNEEEPGVYFHASGAATLIAGPLLDVTEGGDLCLDLLSVAIGMGIGQLISPFKPGHGAHWLATWIVIFFIALVGYLMVRVTRTLWTDWLWVCVALLIHGWIEERKMIHALLHPGSRKAA